MAVYVLRTWKIKPGTWREFQERQVLTESTHARVLMPSEHRAP